MTEPLTYRTGADGLLYPNLTLPEDPEDAMPLGKYGEMRKAFLKEHRRGTYSNLLLNGTLMQHLREVDAEANRMVEQTIREMAKQEGVTEQLKATNQLEWVGRMNNIKSRAEEAVLPELIYS